MKVSRDTGVEEKRRDVAVLPVDYARDLVILGNENVVWVEVWVTKGWPVEPLFFWDELWRHPHVHVEMVEMFLRTGLFVVCNVSVNTVKWEARFTICPEPGHFVDCYTLEDVSSAHGCVRGSVSTRVPREESLGN